MSKPVKFLIVFVVGIPVLIALYFFENIQGYYKFKQYCAKEGGLKVYEKLEKNVGWLAEDEMSARSVAQLKNVLFARYPDKYKEDVFYDLRYIGSHPGGNDSYKKIKSDLAKDAEYVWKIVRGNVVNELRLYKVSYIVLDKNDSAIFKFNRFSYSLFNRDKTILAAPSGEYCYDTGMVLKALNKNLIGMEK